MVLLCSVSSRLRCLFRNMDPAGLQPLDLALIQTFQEVEKTEAEVSRGFRKFSFALDACRVTSITQIITLVEQGLLHRRSMIVLWLLEHFESVACLFPICNVPLKCSKMHTFPLILLPSICNTIWNTLECSKLQIKYGTFQNVPSQASASCNRLRLWRLALL